jgi:hypothetical protein
METETRGAQVLETEKARIVFEPGERGYGYAVEVATAGGWRRVSAAGNPLVAGPSFDLRPDAVRVVDGALELEGRTGAYGWRGEVRVVDGGWFRFDVAIESEGFAIGAAGAVEPQLNLDLGALPPYERGDHVWFKTLVENPTSWNGEGRGNDFPALYYYDPYLKAQFELFYDMTPMSWMGPDTIARFDAYSCGFRRLYRGRPGAEIGLIADAQSGTRFPAGRQEFRWYLRAVHRSDEPTPPSEVEALRELVDDCLPLLGGPGAWPERATTWEDFSRGCAADLMSSDHSWARDDDGEFLLAYVDGRSDAWKVTMEARGRVHGGVGPCLEAAMWALRPLDALLAHGGTVARDATYAALRDRLEAFVRAEVDRPRCELIAGRAATTTPMGTWQYVYMLSELWQLWRDRDDPALLARIRREIDEVAIPLAHHVAHLFPLQFDKRTLRRIGPGPAYPVAGTYALLMIDLADEYGDVRYLDEARVALRALAAVPVDDALQEVVLIAHAVDAATRLVALTGEEEWIGLRDYFRAQTLRMMYWYDDRTSERTRMSSQRGMFLACANIGYPAFFENVEADARLAAVLDAERDPGALLRVLDLGRRNNFSFFPRVVPEMFGPMPLDHIPFEEVPILEGPNDAGFLGQEVYGAGFTFRAHLMWDALAVADDREVMVVSLDGYREREARARRSWRFLAFNSREEVAETRVALPVAAAAGGRVRVEGPGTPSVTTDVAAGDGILLRLGPGAWASLEVTLPG